MEIERTARASSIKKELFHGVKVIKEVNESFYDEKEDFEEQLNQN